MDKNELRTSPSDLDTKEIPHFEYNEKTKCWMFGTVEDGMWPAHTMHRAFQRWVEAHPDIRKAI